MTSAVRQTLFFMAVLTGGLIVVFYQGLFDGGVFVYRDAAHFYYPLFEFIQSEWDAGRIPLWNPYENFGKPLVAGASSSIFYPGKLIFFSPLSYAWNFRLYTIGHVVLAAFGAAFLARRWKRSLIAATLAGISYAFCGSVLMQYCNVIFLVGAAWLPFACFAAERMLIRRTARHAAAFGAILALMTLGGDPQMAYNAGALAVFYAFVLWRRSSTPRAAVRLGERRPVLLGLAACVALVLAAIQVFPTCEYLHSSVRTGTTFQQRLTCDFESTDGHLENVYEFSVGPWRFVELLWPNFGGCQYPENRRWMEAIPAEGRVWTPTLYMGILPFALAFWAMRFRRGNPRLCWMSWTAVLAAVAALGWYGPGWIVHEMGLACGADPDKWLVSAPTGGLYWLMTVFLPGYASFRYPAKLLVVAALAASVTAAYGWDRLRITRGGGFFYLLGGIAALSVLGVGVNLATRPWWNDWLGDVPPNLLFGPLDARGAANVMLWGMCQALIVAAVSFLLLRGVRRGRAVAAVLLLLLTVADLVVANRWIVAFGPSDLWRESDPSQMALSIRGDESDGTRPPFTRVFRRRRWLPESFRKTSSETRLVELFRWDRDTLFPKFSLSRRVGVIGVRGTMVSRSVAMYLDCLEDETNAQDIAFSEALPAEFVIVSGNRMVEGAERVRFPLEDVGVWRMRRPRPWVGVLADPTHDSDCRLLPPAQCRVVSFVPSHAVLDVSLDRGGTVVFSGFDDRDWEVSVESEVGRAETRLFPVMEGGRGLSLEAGTHQLVFRYVPKVFYAGAMLSTAGWAVFMGFIGWRYQKRVFGYPERSHVS